MGENNLEKTRIEYQIQFYRKKQKNLTLQYLKYEHYKAQVINLFDLVPTFTLSDQLG